MIISHINIPLKIQVPFYSNKNNKSLCKSINRLSLSLATAGLCRLWPNKELTPGRGNTQIIMRTILQSDDNNTLQNRYI